ncbi:hypothetical protein [Deinococcus aluminii]|uniref:Uncharacterized protein n=1 Tax=Deinococcus aluminii TaxID=1656885 RepID=A0ABP9XEP0_9DEIO
MPQGTRQKGVSALQLIQFAGPQGIMRRIPVADLAKTGPSKPAKTPREPSKPVTRK